MKWIMLLLIGSLFGCTTNAPQEQIPKASTELEASEGVYIANQDYLALIQLYKRQLTIQEDIELRIKLIEAYVQSGDIDSAHFYMQHIPSNTPVTLNLNYTKGLVYFNDNQPNKAQTYLQQEIENYSDNAKAYNLLGVVFAFQGNYPEARNMLNKTRELHFNDIVVINNLAMLDILEQRYDDATRKLLPIYNNGQADDKVKTNLIIALAMQDNHPAFKTIVSDMLETNNYAQVQQHVSQLIVHQRQELE